MSGRIRALPITEDLVRAIVAAVDDGPHGTRTEAICARLDESPQRLGDAFEFVKERGILLGFAGLWMQPEAYTEGSERFLNGLADAHRQQPSIGGVPPRSVVQRCDLGWTHKATARIVRDLIGAGRLKGDEQGVRLPDFQPQISIKQEVTLARIVQVLDDAGYRPPIGGALALAVHLPTQALPEILRLGEFSDRLVPLEAGIWSTPTVLDRAYGALRRVSPSGDVTIADARDALATSRRYAHAFLVRLATEARAENEDGEWRIL